MKQFLWGNIAGKLYTIGTCLIVGTLAVCVPFATNGLSLPENIIIAFLFICFWLLLGAMLVTIYSRVRR